jgi:hypothetical protein
MKAEITIRACTTLDEFLQCIVLQKSVWGDADHELVPQHIFVVAPKTGGQAFDKVIDSLPVNMRMVVFDTAIVNRKCESENWHKSTF